MRTPHNTRFADAMILPALILLAFLFLFPLGYFFAKSVDGQTLSEILKTARQALSSTEFVNSLITTNIVAAEVTVGCLLVGYPIAIYLTRTSGWRFYLVMFGIIAPTLTSTVVRTFALIVLWGRHGVINNLLVSQLDVLSSPIQMLYNRAAVVAAMIYVLLPYMVLTLFSSMRSIDESLIRASKSLGANEAFVFFKVFLPLTMNGVISGCIMVFIFSLGYYLTPALVGGSGDIMVAQVIQRSIEISFDWAAAAFESIALTAMTLVLFAIYCIFSDMRNLTESR